MNKEKEENKDIKYMEIALKEAKKACKRSEIPVGAVIVKDDQIISKAYNMKEKRQSSLYHAEIVAIDKANKKTNEWRLEGATMYVTLEPCLMCIGAIINARIKRLVFALKDYKTGAVTSKLNIKGYDFYHDLEITEGVLEKESKELIQNFFKDLRKEKKKLKEKLNNNIANIESE